MLLAMMVCTGILCTPYTATRHTPVLSAGLVLLGALHMVYSNSVVHIMAPSVLAIGSDVLMRTGGETIALSALLLHIMGTVYMYSYAYMAYEHQQPSVVLPTRHGSMMGCI